MDRYGAANPNLFWNMVNSGSTGIEAVHGSLSLIDSSATFTNTFQDWSRALYSGNTISWALHPEWSYTSVDTSQGMKENIPLPGLFPSIPSRQNVAALPALSEWSVNFFSYTPSSSTTGTVTWTAASGSPVRAALADASPVMHPELVTAQAYTYSSKGFLVLNNAAGSGSGSGSVTNPSLDDVPYQAETGVLPALLRSPKAMLEQASSDSSARALAEMTNEPQAVCIHTYLQDRERAARAKGRKPFGQQEKP
jgi:hypothetical protein